MVQDELALDRARDALAPRGDRDTFKTEDAVFDGSTLKVLQRLISRGVLATVENSLSSGKEANIFRGKTRDNRNRAVKIYRINTATFRKLAPYLEGDPRFRDTGHSHRGRVFAWAQKEYRNLHAMHAAGARVPRPFVVERNVLVMQYFGWRYRPYPTLRERPPAEPGTFLRELLASVAAYHNAGLSHGDLSEYNVLNFREHPVIIDVGQTVARGHPRWDELHHRDLRNVHRHFRRLLPDLTLEEVTAWST